MSNKTIANFTGILEKYENNLWNYHIKVPESIVDHIKKEKIKRFLCKLNKGRPFHASLMPAGSGIYFIKINKALRSKYNLTLGKKITVQLTKDESTYGIEFPEEMEELLKQDPEGELHFQKLTPGKQRSLLYLVSKIKSTDLKISKSLIILEHLKEQKGALDFKILNQDFKRKKGLQ